MEEEFFATIKFKNGEEIFTKASAVEENNVTHLLLFNPIVIMQIKTNNDIKYKVESWLKTSSEDIMLIKFDDVLLINESTDEEMIDIHTEFVHRKAKTVSYKNKKKCCSKLSREMGYVSSIDEAKVILERLYNNY
jgi:hypothetical protein